MPATRETPRESCGWEAGTNTTKICKAVQDRAVIRFKDIETVRNTELRAYKSVCGSKGRLNTKTQKQKVLKLAKRLLKSINNLKVVTDDESYFTLEGHNQTGNDSYYTKNVDTVKLKVRFKRQQKYSPKLCVWLAISPRDRSQPFFVSSKCVLNAERYLTKDA